MKHVLIYEDADGNCRIIYPNPQFQQPNESEESALSRLYHLAIPNITEFLACNPDKLPTDLTFRDAWEKGNETEPIKIDFNKALQIHRKRLLKASQSKIAQLTHQLSLALEIANLPQSVALRRTIHILRTMDQMNLTHCKTIQDIKFAIPNELKDVWDFYPV